MAGYSDNNGWGQDVGHGYNNSSFRKEEVGTRFLSFFRNSRQYELVVKICSGSVVVFAF
jgi:hypothetical protein